MQYCQHWWFGREVTASLQEKKAGFCEKTMKFCILQKAVYSLAD
jgi:hypothetical protein